MNDLGFEVGYCSHFEIGWVQKKYAELVAQAQSLGVASPEKFYSDGKVEGDKERKANRWRIDEGQETPEEKKEAARVKISKSIHTESESDNRINATKFLKKPRLHNFPDMVKKYGSAKLPEFLKFRGLR